MAHLADSSFWLPGSTRRQRKDQHLGSLLSKSTRMHLSWWKIFSGLSQPIDSWTTISCSKVKLSLCRGPTEAAEVVVEAIEEEDSKGVTTKLNQRWEEVTITEVAFNGEVAGDSITTSISTKCRMGSVAVMQTSTLSKMWVLSSLTWKSGKDCKGLTLLTEKVILLLLSHPHPKRWVPNFQMPLCP